MLIKFLLFGQTFSIVNTQWDFSAFVEGVGYFHCSCFAHLTKRSFLKIRMQVVQCLTNPNENMMSWVRIPLKFTAFTFTQVHLGKMWIYVFSLQIMCWKAEKTVPWDLFGYPSENNFEFKKWRELFEDFVSHCIQLLRNSHQLWVK